MYPNDRKDTTQDAYRSGGAQLSAPVAPCEAPKLEMIDVRICELTTRLGDTVEMLGMTADRILGASLGNPPPAGLDKPLGNSLSRIHASIDRLSACIEAAQTQARRFTAL